VRAAKKKEPRMRPGLLCDLWGSGGGEGYLRPRTHAGYITFMSYRCGKLSSGDSEIRPLFEISESPVSQSDTRHLRSSYRSGHSTIQNQPLGVKPGQYRGTATRGGLEARLTRPGEMPLGRARPSQSARSGIDRMRHGCAARYGDAGLDAGVPVSARPIGRPAEMPEVR
jgi:hypothetical protein